MSPCCKKRRSSARPRPTQPRERPDQAAAVLNKPVELGRKRFEAWIALAALAMATKQAEKADEILAEAAKHVADNADFRVARVRFWARYRADRSESLTKFEKDL